MNIFQACYILVACTTLFDTSLAFGSQWSFTRSNSNSNPKSGNCVSYAATIEVTHAGVADSSDVKLVSLSKRSLSSGVEEHQVKEESSASIIEKEEEMKPKNPAVVKLQRILRYKQKAYQNYLINQSIELKLKPIYVRKGKIDTYTPQPIHDAETERLLKEVWEAESEVRVMEAQSVDSEVESLKKENKLLENRLKAIQADVSRLVSQMQEKRREIDSKDATIASLQIKLEEMEATLRVLQEERTSFRLLARQAWRMISSRINQRVVRVKNLLFLRKSNDEQKMIVTSLYDDTNGVNNNEAIKTAVALQTKK